MVWPNTVRRRARPWRMFGIPIYIDTSWFFIVALVTWTLSTGYFPAQYRGFDVVWYWGMGLLSAVLLFVCVLLHELGHSLMARRHGIPVTGVTLFIFGGVAQLASEARRPSVELKVALAGPLVSIVLAGICIAAGRVITVHSPIDLAVFAIARYLAIINIVILVFNLLPGFPLDGGRVLRALLWGCTGNLGKATRIACSFGSGLGVGLLILGLWAVFRQAWLSGMWYMLLGFFLRNAARASLMQVKRLGL